MAVQAISTWTVIVAAMLLGCGVVVPAESSRALLDLTKLIDHWIDCSPPPADEVLPAPEPYAAPYVDSPPFGTAPAPATYEPPSPEYQSPPGPPYADASPPVYQPSPEYPTPPAAGSQPSPEYLAPRAIGY